MELINHTLYTAGMIVDTDREGADTLVLAVKATFDIEPDGSVRPSEKQREIEWGDVYAGEPGKSSVLYESDATWGRTGTDVALIGYAYPRRLGDRQVDVSLQVGPLAKTARVFGDRRWETVLGGTRISVADPFEKIPLVWERSFGGVDATPDDPNHHALEARNPVGRGFRAKQSQLKVDGARLPNIEDPRHLVSTPTDRPAPVGFGFVAKSWMPRVSYVGTYDDRWQKARAPLLPDDYDSRYTVAAAEGLWAADGLKGGEVVDLTQLTPSGRLRFTLPRVNILGSFLALVPLTELDMRLAVVFIDAVRMNLVLLWQGSHSIHGLVDDMRWVRALDEATYVEEDEPDPEDDEDGEDTDDVD
jgi:hypothetical protein